MPDNDPGQSIPSQSDQNGTTPEAINPPLPPNSVNPEDAQSIAAQQVQSEVKTLEDRIKSAEKWMIGLTGIIALCGLLQFAASILQWHTMSGQLAEMRSGSVDTHALAVAAGKQAQQLTNLVTQATAQANAAKAGAEATGKVADSALAQAKATNELAKQAKRSANATQDALTVSRSNLDLAKNALLVQERPWMGVSQTSATFDNGVSKTTITLTNLGKSPAFRVTYHGELGARPPTTYRLYETTDANTRTIVMPGGNFESAELTWTPPFQELNRINQGFATIYFFGEITYYDLFTSGNPKSGPHVTHFCRFWDRTAKKFWDCPTYNDAD